jgi:hypothetical protein
VLERLKANRVCHLATAHVRKAKLRRATEALRSQRKENAKLKLLLKHREAELQRLGRGALKVQAGLIAPPGGSPEGAWLNRAARSAALCRPRTGRGSRSR